MTAPPSGSSNEVRERTAALVEALGGSAEVVADRILEHLVGEIPGYGRLAENTETRIHEGATALVTRFVAMMEGRGPLTPDEVAEIESMADLTADAGMRGEDMSAACWVAVRVACELLTERAQDLPESRATTVALGRVTAAACEFIQEAHDAVSRGHLAHHARHATQRDRGVRDLVDDLLAGQVSGEECSDRAARLGIDVGPHLGALLIVAPQDVVASSSALRQFQASCLDNVDAALGGPVLSSPVPHAVAVLSCRTPAERDHAIDALDRVATREGFTALATDFVDQTSAIGDAYQDAMALLPTVQAVAGPGASATSDFGIFRLLRRSPELSHSLVRDTLGPVLDLPDARTRSLVETLDALWEAGGAVREAASRLHLSEKAVRNRIHRIRELTGLDPALPPDRLRLDLARHALRLWGEAAPRSG